MKLTKYQATHLYELAYDNFQDGCYDCDNLKELLEKFIGVKEYKNIQKLLKKHPYHNNYQHKNMLKDLSNALDKINENNLSDAEVFKNLDEDTCMLCGAQGADKRSLWMSCFYDISEVVPEALSMQKVSAFEDNDTLKRLYYLRICKCCRSKLLEALEKWRNDIIPLRNKKKDSDGYIDEDDANETNLDKYVFVREYGIIKKVTLKEYNEKYATE